MPTKPSEHADSPSLYVEFALTDSEMESEEEVPVIKAGDQDEGQARPNHGEQDEGQTGSNPGDAAESQPQPSHVVHAGPNLKHMDLETTDASTQQKPEQIDEEFTTIAYPNVQENLKLLTEDQFFVEKPQEEEPGKTNAEAELEQHITNPIQNNLALEERLDKHGFKLYKLENLNIPHQVSKAVNEIVTDVVDWAMQAPLRARFRDLPTLDMKEILQQRMYEDNTYKTHEVHNDLYESLKKLVELDYSNQCLADQEEARKKKRKRRESPRTPLGSPPIQPPHLLQQAHSVPQVLLKHQDPLSFPYLLLLHLLVQLDLHINKSADIPRAQELSPTDYLMQDDSIPKEQIHFSDDEDSENDHQPKADSRKDWWKPLPKEERPATPELAWTIPSSNKSDVVSNWASVLATTYDPPAENSLLAKIGDMTTFMNCILPDIIYLQFQMEECHKMLTAQVDWTNPEEDHVKIDVNRPLPLGGPPVQNMASLTGALIDISSILTDMILRRVEKMSEHICGFSVSSESKHTQDTGHLDHLPGSDKRMLSTAVKQWTQNLVLRQQHDYTIIEFPRVVVFPIENNDQKIMRFNEIYKFSDGTLTHILEALDYRVKEFKVKLLNPGMNTRFWTQKDVTRSKEFIAAIERRLKTRRIFQNLECFVGGRVRDIDYRLLQRTE
ncbi:hypothetical protein Tco_0490570 [Tanacetum coccineum]